MSFVTHETIPFPSYQPNELNERVVGIPAINPFFRSVSGPRAAMFNKHIAQRPTLICPTPQRLSTGLAFELGKYTYSKVIPANSYTIDVILKYHKTISGASFKNPLITVIFERYDTQEIDSIDLTRHHSQHQYFGFDYNYDYDALSEIRPDNRILQDLVIADSPAKDKNGDYKFGVHANMTLTSDPVGIEDGIKISESFCKKLGFSCYESRTIVFNDTAMGMNIYGDENTYKLFPEIGEHIRPDGMLFAVRELGDNLAPSQLSVKSLQQPNLYDTCTFGHSNAEVVDIKIIKGSLQQPVFYSGMEDQLNFHHSVQTKYYQRILDAYNKVKKIYGESLKISNGFSNLVREAHAVRKAHINPLSWRGNKKLMGWQVTVTYKYSLIPVEGFKLTDQMG